MNMRSSFVMAAAAVDPAATMYLAFNLDVPSPFNFAFEVVCTVVSGFSQLYKDAFTFN